MSKYYYIYILTNINRNVFYIGVTNNLIKRLHEHKSNIVKGFSQRYNLKFLIYYEQFTDIRDAIQREKQLKSWHRDWKINLIKSINAEMKDLSDDLL